MSVWLSWSTKLTKHTRLSFSHRVGGKKSGFSWLFLPFYWMFKIILLAMAWMIYGLCWLMWQFIKWPCVLLWRGAKALVRSGAQSAKSVPNEKKISVAGVYYYTSGIKAAGIPNPLFQLSKKEFLQANTGYKVYEFQKDGYVAQLIEEPDNEYDPNAVKVVIAGQKVGHIPREECLEIKKLIHKRKIVSVTATLMGGRYKLIDRDSGSVTTVNGDYAITLTLNLR